MGMIVVLTMVFVGAVAGGTLAIRNFRVLLLVPIIVILAASTIATGIVEKAGSGTIALETIAVIVAPQLSYLATGFFAYLIAWPRTLPGVPPVEVPLHDAAEHAAEHQKRAARQHEKFHS
jgi:hypothetical protein